MIHNPHNTNRKYAQCVYTDTLNGLGRHSVRFSDGSFEHDLHTDAQAQELVAAHNAVVEVRPREHVIYNLVLRMVNFGRKLGRMGGYIQRSKRTPTRSTPTRKTPYFGSQRDAVFLHTGWGPNGVDQIYAKRVNGKVYSTNFYSK